MIISAIPIYWIILWAVFATGFYLFRYRKIKSLRNPWIIGGIFALNFFLFAYGIIFFIFSEYLRSKAKKKEE